MATKQFYTLLPGEENIIDHEDSGDIQETKGPLSNKKRHPTYKVWTSIILYIIIAALLIIIVIESMLLIRNPALLTPSMSVSLKQMYQSITNIFIRWLK